MQKITQLVYRGVRRLVLDPGEAFLITRMAGWILVLSTLVRFQPLPKALQIVSARNRPSTDDKDVVSRRLVRAIDLLLSLNLLVFKPICWKRAAILHRYLALHGLNTQIVFGVRPLADGKIDGHAWLETDGVPILENTPPDYKVTYTFPSADRDFEISPLPT